MRGPFLCYGGRMEEYVIDPQQFDADELAETVDIFLTTAEVGISEGIPCQEVITGMAVALKELVERHQACGQSRIN